MLCVAETLDLLVYFLPDGRVLTSRKGIETLKATITNFCYQLEQNIFCMQGFVRMNEVVKQWLLQSSVDVTQDMQIICVDAPIEIM